VALAVDLLSRHGGSATLNSGDIPGLLTSMSPDQYVQDFISGWQWLKELDFTLSERVGMTGFCFGGGVTWRVATQMPELKAGAFLGCIGAGDVYQAAVLAIYGEHDRASADCCEAAQQNEDLR
jgi:carboxymethylenebutenolidase